jgi:hypothetical protein
MVMSFSEVFDKLDAITEGFFQSQSGILVCVFGLGNDSPHIDKSVNHTVVNL